MSRNSSVPNRLGDLKSGIRKRDFLIQNEEFSLPVGEARSVIFTSGQSREDLEVLAEHARQLALDNKRGLYGAEIVKQARRGDVFDYLRDKDYANMAFLGDGNFGTIHLYAGYDTYERVTWYQLIREADHLKTGVMEERTCSMILNPDREIRVSLTSLITLDQSKINGTYQMSFGNHAGFDIFNEHVGQLYNAPINSMDKLRRPGNFTF